MHALLKKALAGALSYGIIFTYPAWTVYSRLANAGGANPVETETTRPTRAIVNTHVDRSPAPKPEKSEEDPEKKKHAQAQFKSCSDPGFYDYAAGGTNLYQGLLCNYPSIEAGKRLENSGCWMQFFTLLSTAETNGILANDPGNADRAAATATAAATSVSQDLSLKAYDRFSTGEGERDLKAINQKIIDNEAIKADRAECCRKLVAQADGLAHWIEKNPNPAGSSFPRDKVQSILGSYADKCERGHGGGAVAVVHAKEEKKKNNWAAIIIAAVVAIVAGIFLFKKKKGAPKKKNPKKPKKPKKPTDGGTTGTSSTSGTTTPGTVTTSTGNTYPGTTTTGRDNTTGANGSGTYPAETTTTGRANTTGANGTVTGSTTAVTGSTPTTSTTTTGNTYPGTTGDPGRTTDGTSRTLIK